MEITTVEARQHFSDVVNKASYAKDRIVLTRRGKAVAAIIPVEDLEALRAMEDEADRKAIARARREKPIPWKKVKKELGL